MSNDLKFKVTFAPTVTTLHESLNSEELIDIITREVIKEKKNHDYTRWQHGHSNIQLSDVIAECTNVYDVSIKLDIATLVQVVVHHKMMIPSYIEPAEAHKEMLSNADHLMISASSHWKPESKFFEEWYLRVFDTPLPK